MTNGNSKGMSPLGWVAIGCGGCLVVVLLAMAACGGFAWFRFGDAIKEAADNPAKALALGIVRANPDLELVSSDDDANTLTIRDKDGKTFTVDWNEIKEGRLRLETDEGEMRVEASGSGEDGTLTISGPDGERAAFGAGADDTPAWVPRYPDAGDITGSFSNRNAAGQQGAFTFTTGDSVRDVVDWYLEELTSEGFEEASRLSHGEMINLSLRRDKQTLTVVAIREQGKTETQVNIQYSETP